DIESEFRSYAMAQRMSEAEIERELAVRLERRHRTIHDAAHVLCVSTVLRDRLVARHGLDPARSTVVPCVADPAKFGPDDAERAQVRRELGLDGRFVVVYPGRFGAWHYNEETFAVVRGLMDADPSVYFLVLTPDLEAAQTLAARTLPAGRYQMRSV